MLFRMNKLRRNKILVMGGFYWSNFIDNIIDAYWEKKKVILECRCCGRLLAPFVEPGYEPRGAGWKRIRGKYSGWICHQCYCGTLFDVEYAVKHMEFVEEENKKIKKKIFNYRLKHPWIKIRKKYRGV